MQRSERARRLGCEWEAEKIKGQGYKLAQMLVFQCLAWLLGLRGGQLTCGPATPQTQPSATSGATELGWRTGDIARTSWVMRIAANVCLSVL